MDPLVAIKHGIGGPLRWNEKGGLEVPGWNKCRKSGKKKYILPEPPGI
jgi:hypothetical protein